MIIYGIKNCMTVRKALAFLDQNQIAYTFHDYKKQAIDAETLQSWLSTYGREPIVNTRGTTWRNLSEAEKQKALSGDVGLIEILQQYPSIIKRPILQTPNGLIIGFNESLYAELKKL